MVNSFNVEPVVDKFDDPFYPVVVTIGNEQGEIVFHHDREYGRYLIGDDDLHFKQLITRIQSENKMLWAKITTEIKNAVFQSLK